MLSKWKRLCTTRIEVGYSAMFGRLSWTRLSSLRFSLRFMIAFGLRFRQRTQVVSEKIVSKSCLKRKRSAFMTEASRGLFADEVDWKGKSLIKIESGCFLCRSDHSHDSRHDSHRDSRHPSRHDSSAHVSYKRFWALHAKQNPLHVMFHKQNDWSFRRKSMKCKNILWDCPLLSLNCSNDDQRLVSESNNSLNKQELRAKSKEDKVMKDMTRETTEVLQKLHTNCRWSRLQLLPQVTWVTWRVKG